MRRAAWFQRLNCGTASQHPFLVLRIPLRACCADAAGGVSFFVTLDRHKSSGGIESGIKSNGLNERAASITGERNWKLTHSVVLQSAVITHKARRKIWKNKFLIHKLKTLKSAGGQQQYISQAPKLDARGHERGEFPVAVHLRDRETHGANRDKSKHELEELKDARSVKIQDHHHECDDSRTVPPRRNRGVRGIKKARRLNNHVHADTKNIERGT